MKSYYNGLSDEKLLEKLNQCEMYEWLCFMQLQADEQIKDKDLFWRWRVFLGSHMTLIGREKKRNKQMANKSKPSARAA